MEKTSTPCFSPLTCSCLIAAGLYTSHATRRHFFPFCLNLPASFAVVVVLPAPCSTHIIRTVMAFPGCSCISADSLPISAISSSFTILITICPGFKPFMTSAPTALSSTVLINCFTTLKLTSASKSAILTSFRAAFTSSSVRRPLLRRFLNTFCSFSVKLSNAMYYNSSKISSAILCISDNCSVSFISCRSPLIFVNFSTR